MRVSLVGAELSESEKESLARRLIGAFAEVEVGHDTPAVRSGFLVHFERVAETDLFLGDQRMSDSHLRQLL